MIHLVITVLAIALAALLAVGGLSYFSTSIGTRITVSKGLASQREAISAAVSAYGIANNGLPPPIGAIVDGPVRGYLPTSRMGAVPAALRGFTWYVVSSGGSLSLCVDSPLNADPGAVRGLISFAATASRAEGTSVLLANSCDGERTEYDLADADEIAGTVSPLAVVTGGL